MLSWALGLGILSMAVFCLGIAGFLSKGSFLLLLLSGFLIFLRSLKNVLLDSFSFFKTRARVSFQYDDAVVLTLLGFYFLLTFFISLAPSVYWDELHYHLTVPRIYLQEHRIVYIPYFYYSNFPHFMEMLFTFGLALGSDSLATLFHWFFGVLCVLLCAVAGKRYWNFSSGILGGLFFYSMPVMVWLSNVSYVDLALTFYLCLGVYCFFIFAETHSRTHLCLSAVFLAFASQNKYSGLVGFVIVFVFALIWIAVFRRRSLAPLFYFTCVFIVFTCPYYLKNMFFTGNPFYPFFYGYFGGKDITAEVSMNIFQSIRSFGGRTVGLSGFLSLPWDLTMNGPYFGGGTGPVFLSLLPVVVLFALKDTPSRVFALFGLCYTLFWFLGSPQTRFLLPAVLFFSLVCARTVGYLKHHFLAWFFFWFLSVFFCVVSMFFICMIHWPRLLVVAGKIQRTVFLEDVLETYSAFQALKKIVPPSETIYMINDNRVYYCPRPFLLDYAYQPGYHTESVKPVQRYQSLKKRGIRYLVLNSWMCSGDKAPCRIVNADLRAGGISVVLEKNGVYVLKRRE